MYSDTLSLLKKNILFQACSDDDLNTLISFAKTKIFKAGEYLIHEGDNDQQEFYLIQSGKVEILKKSNKPDPAEAIVITTLEKGETFGEIALLGFKQRIASVKAIKQTTVLVIPIDKLNEIQNTLVSLTAEKSSEHSAFYNTVLINLGKQLSQRLYNTNLITVETLQRQLVLQRERIDSIRFFLTMLFILAIYSYCTAFLKNLINAPNAANKSELISAIISLVMMVVFFGGTMIVISKNSFPLSFYGLTLKRWKRSAFEGLLYTIPVLFVLLLVKFIALRFYGLGDSLIEFDPQHLSALELTGMVTLYFVLASMQEIVARGAVLSSLIHFLSGRHKKTIAVALSDLLFGMIHLHISLELAIAVLFFGFYWGWMFLRQQDIVGVSISHALTGFIAFNVIGFEEFIPI